MPDAPGAVKYPLTGGSADTTLSIWLFKDVKNSKCVVISRPFLIAAHRHCTTSFCS